MSWCQTKKTKEITLVVKEWRILQDLVPSPLCLLQLYISSHVGPPTFGGTDNFGLFFNCQIPCQTLLFHCFSHRHSADLYPSSFLDFTILTILQRQLIRPYLPPHAVHARPSTSYFVSTSVSATLSSGQALLSLLFFSECQWSFPSPPTLCLFLLPQDFPCTRSHLPQPLTNTNLFPKQLPNKAQQCCWAAQQLQTHHQLPSTSTEPHFSR